MELKEKEELFLQLYKDGKTNMDITQIYGNIDNYPFRNSNRMYILFPNIGLHNDKWWVQCLNSKNINAFLSFLSNPKDIPYYRDIDVSFLDGMIDMIETLIDLSCKCTLEGRNRKANHRIENRNNINDYNIRIPSFKSTSSKKYDSGETSFAKTDDSVLIYIDQSEFCPHIDIDYLISSIMGDEAEIIFPPFLNANINKINDNKYQTTISYNPDTNEILNSDDITSSFLETNKSQFVEGFKKFCISGEITSEFKNNIELLKCFLQEYANKKYKETYNTFINSSTLHK